MLRQLDNLSPFIRLVRKASHYKVVGSCTRLSLFALLWVIIVPLRMDCLNCYVQPFDVLLVAFSKQYFKDPGFPLPHEAQTWRPNGWKNTKLISTVDGFSYVWIPVMSLAIFWPCVTSYLACSVITIYPETSEQNAKIHSTFHKVAWLKMLHRILLP